MILQTEKSFHCKRDGFSLCIYSQVNKYRIVSVMQRKMDGEMVELIEGIARGEVGREWNITQKYI